MVVHSIFILDILETIFFLQMISLAVLLIPSALLEPWNVFWNLTWVDWCVFVSFTVLVFLVGTACNIFAIRHLGATTAGALLSLRLITAMIAGGIILQEQILSIWPCLGTTIVIAGISFFMYCKRQEAVKK